MSSLNEAKRFYLPSGVGGLSATENLIDGGYLIDINFDEYLNDGMISGPLWEVRDRMDRLSSDLIRLIRWIHGFPDVVNP